MDLQIRILVAGFGIFLLRFGLVIIVGFWAWLGVAGGVGFGLGLWFLVVFGFVIDCWHFGLVF